MKQERAAAFKEAELYPQLTSKKKKSGMQKTMHGVCKHGKKTVAKPDIEKYLLNEAARGIQSSLSIDVHHSG